MNLSDREAIIETCQHAIQQSWVEIGQQLSAIRDERLYKLTHASFDAYCQERWGYSESYVVRLIGGAEVVKNLEETLPIGKVFETHVRPLTPLEPDQQRQACQEANDTASFPSRGPVVSMVSILVSISGLIR